MSRNLETFASKISVVGQLLRRQGADGRILVVGCGDGREAGQLARDFATEVVGIDIGADFAFETEAAWPAQLMTMDAQDLQFADGSFDVVYSFHALVEHIEHPLKALSEMRRVLRVGGVYLVGTPNRQRAVGYVGSASPVKDRIRWNLADWRDRARGRWSNELGAHAGFTATELLGLCEPRLGCANDVSDDYYLALYPGKAGVINSLVRTGLRRYAYPAVYVAGRRTGTEQLLDIHEQ